MKIVINKCFGGFSLSRAAIVRYAEIKGFTLYPENLGSSFRFTTYYLLPPEKRVPKLESDAWHKASEKERIAYNKAVLGEALYDGDIERTDPALVQTVEEMGDSAFGRFAQLAIVEIPDGVDWEIDEHDGNEHVSEKHRTWS